MAMHEMHEVSGLPMGEVPYEEFIPESSELKRLQSEHPAIYKTYWELMCHYHICFDQTCGKKKTGVYVSHKNWADYLFENLDKKGAPVAPLGPSDRVTVETRIFESLPVLFTLGSDLDGFKAGTTFESFHHQAVTPISAKALLAGYLMLWLKRCVVPCSQSFEVVTAEVIYPAVLLAYGRPYALLPAMMACIQSGLRHLTTSFCQTRMRKDEEGKEVLWTPNPRVGLPYTYLMAWFVLHYPSLMSAP